MNKNKNVVEIGLFFVVFGVYLFFIYTDMKELIAKLKQQNADIVKHYEANDKDAVLKTLEEIAPVLKELEEKQEAEASKEEENSAEKTLEDVNKTLEEVKKYADLYVTADSLQKLKEELKTFTDGITEKVSKLEEGLKNLAETEQPSQQQETVTKTEESIRW